MKNDRIRRIGVLPWLCCLFFLGQVSAFAQASYPMCRESGRCEGSKDYLDCLNGLADAADKQLNYKYYVLQQAIKKHAADQSVSPRPFLNKLKSGSRSWILYRDATCSLINELPDTGHGGGNMIDAYDCMCKLTYRRIEDIDKLTAISQ